MDALTRRALALAWSLLISCSAPSAPAPSRPEPEQASPADAREALDQPDRADHRPTAPEQPSADDGLTLRMAPKPCRTVAGGELQELDINHDGQVDVVDVHRDDGRPFCRELDLNFDGAFDVVRFFDSAGQNVREEMDLDFDGRVDQVTVFRGGLQLATISDTNQDGRGDLFRCFREGRPVEQRQDLDGDGRVDRWEWYTRDERLVGSSYDEDGDGVPDEQPPRGVDTSACPPASF